jgi:hypothetical protein
VHVPARPFGQPFADERGFVRGVIVHGKVNVEVARHSGLDLVKELTELRGAVAPISLADNPPGSDIESGKQRCGAVPAIVMAFCGRAGRAASPKIG